ncbi:ATP-binding protein [Streptomyces sp. WAC 04229]|uniref:ATP-binding protein n=1 Tax=Streptomyces sp. WAC 04229 TaxID=2203206 RepID=UPI003D707E56
MDDDRRAEAQHRLVRCPSCLEELYFDDRRLFLPVLPSNKMEPWDPSTEPNAIRRADQLNRAFLKCPNERVTTHFLPVPYLLHDRPLTVAFVGQSGTGKTHLLAAMMAEIGRGGLDPLGIRCRSVNSSRHHAYLAGSVNELEAGRVLPQTAARDFVEFTDALLVTVDGRTRPVAFFDVAGESLKLDGPATEFLLGVDAVIFVVDALRALRLNHLVLAREIAGVSQIQPGVPDPTFSIVLDRLPRKSELCELPTAIVLNKCDVLRFEPPVDHWLRADVGPPHVPTAEEIYRESRDVYAFLSHHQATPWLKPFAECRRCTLHFVSATGMSPAVLPSANRPGAGAFASAIRPRRVLGPLLSIFQMCGLLPSPGAATGLKGV